MVNGAPTNPITGTRPAKRRDHALNRFADVAQVVGIGNREAVDVVRGPHGIVDHRPFARDEAQFQSHRLHGKQQIGEDDGGIHVQDFHRLQGYLSRQIGALADFQEPMMLPDLPVLLQIASGLPHEPHRPNVGRPPAACV